MNARCVNLGLAFFLLPTVGFESRDSVRDFSAVSRSIGASEMIGGYLAAAAVMQQQKAASPS